VYTHTHSTNCHTKHLYGSSNKALALKDRPTADVSPMLVELVEQKLAEQTASITARINALIQKSEDQNA